jgi:hypothetical protein
VTLTLKGSSLTEAQASLSFGLLSPGGIFAQRVSVSFFFQVAPAITGTSVSSDVSGRSVVPVRHATAWASPPFGPQARPPPCIPGPTPIDWTMPFWTLASNVDMPVTASEPLLFTLTLKRHMLSMLHSPMPSGLALGGMTSIIRLAP